MDDMAWELLDRYLAGECTPDEAARVEAWLRRSPLHQAIVDALREAVVTPPTVPLITPREKAEAWARLEREMSSVGELGAAATPADSAARPPLRLVRGELEAGQGSARPRTFEVPIRMRWPMLSAAAIAVALVVGGAVLAPSLLRRHAPAVAVRTLTTPAGQRATFQLPDGTRVMLGVASTLRYAADYGDTARNVSLEGEAYFEVKHDEHRPFMVKAGDILAKDLGTEFTVRAYADDAHARVVVRKGEVGLRSAHSADATVRVLEPGQLGRLAANGDPTVEAVDVADYLAWTEGRLIVDAALREALPQLSRWFDLDFRLADSALGDIALTATLRTQPTPDVLDNLAASLGLRQVKRGRVVTFYRVVAGQ